MKRIALLFTVCCLSFVACNEKPEPVVPSGDAPEGLYVLVGEQGETKSYFVSSEGGKKFTHYWNEGDDISVFWGSSDNLMYRANNINKSTGYSDFKITGYSTTGSSSVAATSRYAMYPYCNTNKVVEASGTPTFHYSLPAAQTYRQVDSAGVNVGTFGTASYNNGSDSKTMGCAVYIARNQATTTEKNNYFDFYNVGCWLRVSLKTDSDAGIFNVGKLVLTNDAVAVCGDAACTGDPNSISAVSFTFPTAADANKSITLSCPSGITLSKDKGTSFYFYLLPIGLNGGFTNGFTVKVYDTDDNLRANLASSIQDYKPGDPTYNLFLRNQVVNTKLVTLTSASISYTLTVESWGDGGTTDINLE